MTQEKIDHARRRMVSAAGTVPLALAVGGGTALLSTQALAQADDWPKKTIRVVVPFPAGALTDTIARVMAEGLSKSLGQPVVVENKLGANGVIGASDVARSAPDGHTWLLTNSSSITINPQLYKSIPYKASDLAPITPIVESPFIIIANPEWAQKNKINTLRDLLAHARANPERVRYGSPGLGNLAHLGAREVRTAVLVDRCIGKQPIHADIVGLRLQVAPGDVIECNVPPYEEHFRVEVLRRGD